MPDLTDAIAAAHAALDERFYPGPTEEMVACIVEAVADDLRAEGAAKALREAADFGEQEGDPVDDVCDWLRARADAIEAGQP